MFLRKSLATVSFSLIVCALVFLGASNATAQCVNLTSGSGSVYTQDFNTLSNTAGSTTNSLTIPGWFLSETGTSARVNNLYAVDTGSSNTGDIYSYGSAGSSDRALGTLMSGTITPVIGACFTNNTGSNITALMIQYTGKQFRVGTISRTDRLDFQYSTTASAVNTPSVWTDYNDLDFTDSPGAVVGVVNPAASTTVGPQTVSGLSIANGSTFWVRWTDFDASGADDGLALDDFSLTAITDGGVISTNPSATGSATATSAGGTTNFSGTITPGTNPDSTSFTVSCDLTSLGDGANFALNVSGTSFSGNYIVPSGIAAKSYGLPCIVTDDQGRKGTFTISLVVNAQLLTIMQIQGSGSRSPYEGQPVRTSGVVYDVSFNGFWIQDPVGDGDPSTSDGVFVFTSSAPSGVHQGDSVSVSGTVSEFAASGDPSASPQTEISGSPSFTVQSSGNPLPSSVAITAADIDPNGGIDQLERYEGMRVHVDTLNVVAPTSGTVNEANATSSSNGVFYGVIPGLPRPFRKAGIELPALPPAGSPCCIPSWNGAPQRLRVDTDVISAALGAGLNLTSGAIVSDLTGPLDFAQHAYTIVTETLPNIVSGNISAIPVPTPDESTEFTVSSFNMQRFFDTTNDAGISDVALTSTAFANRLNKASLAIRNVMKTPDIIGVEEMENLATLQAVADKVNSDAVAAGQPNPGYTPYLVEGNDIGGIDVGFLVRSRVTVNSVTQYGKDTTFVEPGGATAILNDRPPLVLDGSITNEHETLHFIAVVVHQRSLSSVDDPADGPRVREKRRQQAEYLANLLQSFQASDPNAKIVSMGDFNAFEFNDGYTDIMGTVEGHPTPADQVLLASDDLVDPNFTDLETTLPEDQRYSYVDFGASQTLDHMIVSQGMLGILSRFAYARNDADFPDTYRNDPNRPERISDHDMEVGYFKLPVDSTAPVLTLPADFTVEATSPAGAIVTYTATALDTNDGPASVLCNPASGSSFPLGVNTVSCTSQDARQNVATGTFHVNVVDTTAPVVSVTGVTNGATYVIGAVPLAGCSTVDNVSPISTKAAVVVSGGTANGVGLFTATCSGGQDAAGNIAAPASVSFTVTYRWEWLFPPSGLPLFKVGNDVPLLWRLSNAKGLKVVGNRSSVRSIQVASNPDCSGTAEGTPFNPASTAGLQYAPLLGIFEFDWKTKGLTAGCYNVLISLDDGTLHTESVKLRK